MAWVRIENFPMILQGPPVSEASYVVIVIHGMSTTANTMIEGFPMTDDQVAKIYWRLPILREGRESLEARRREDLFLKLFVSVVEESRKELSALIRAIGRSRVGLFGFSIGSLIALWGALDNTEVGAVVAFGGVPNMDYLKYYYPEYDWQHPNVRRAAAGLDLTQRVGDLAKTPIFVSHGERDSVAWWEWMRPCAEALQALAPNRVRMALYPHLHHRLGADAEGEEEAQELLTFRTEAEMWFRRWLDDRSLNVFVERTERVQ